ncbi:tRNA glutamyl-Q(34) synthetase GluQRS [Devosia sp. XJ19-1]|uniref:tRNA glutamyl-Q(34) synthetase GluQRS n=1 Tax=Devosia ureilytica TaxID=2952754 RepID=A0A9Q4FSN0_9HYPH|nr:tRNA glutamyl-Q(34) synthetase GluQRS [Devosia ureilytica]MCP8882627.1 tRNA glutamyl-Q(34) synthetase GluQRS [Devosia ureilytica]MCP8887004.1 tRNA glutamyl-Q(34) synthetase GluQRS [Devosia ureilytica]
MSKPLLRFAPSPNGHLHLGHALSALVTWNAAQSLGGITLLRIEDIDQSRCKPEFTQAIFDDLTWLGLTWPEPVLIQSERFDLYAEAANRLRAMDLIYPCFCSRTEIAEASTSVDPDGAPLYPGTCRHLSNATRIARLERGDPVQFRLDTEAALARTGMLTFTVIGPTLHDRPQIRHARPERWGDVVLQRKDTPTSYHLSVVVDDAAQHITHVTRGRDLEAATDIHVLLQMLLGLPTPFYHFHRLLLGDDGQKLAKSKGSQSLSDLRALGWTPDDVRRAVGF